jgi:hypothetical protein
MYFCWILTNINDADHRDHKIQGAYGPGQLWKFGFKPFAAWMCELLYILLSYLDNCLAIDGFLAQKAYQNAGYDDLASIIMKSSVF